MTPPTYSEAIVQSDLYRQFDELAGFENVSLAEVQQLKSLVLEVANLVEPFMERIQVTFRQYTKHDLHHLLNIAGHIYSFLPRRNDKPSAIHLNAIELAYLWLAILLHDVGMFVSEADEKQSILDSVEYEAHRRHHRERLDAADKAEQNKKTVKADSIRDAVFAEFIRQRHAERVHGFISKYLANKLRFRGADLAKDVGYLCESHNWGVRQSRDSRKPKQCILEMNRRDLVGNTPVNHAYLACCLRLGDILDFDRTRTPLSAFHVIHFTESVSIDEWNKHLSIKGVSVTGQRVEYVAECSTPADYVAVHHFLDWVDRELQDTTRLVREFPKELAERYQLHVTPVVDRHQVRMADPKYVAGGFRFQLDYEQIMKLLMDKSLYPDETMFLRELLQNALDACRYQKARAQEKGMEGKYVPRIQVWDGSALPHDPDKPEKGPRIVFQDNGVGMSLSQVENFFMRVGRSYYRSADFRAERERLVEKGIHLDACSRFGIGFLSCFLGGDRIVVETFQYGSEPLRITIEGASKYFVIERLPAVDLLEFPPFVSPGKPEDDSPPLHSGTKITVYLREDWRSNPSANDENLVYTTLDAYAVNQEFPIFVSGPKWKTNDIPERRWDRHPPSFPGANDISDKWVDYLVSSSFRLEGYHAGLRGQGSIWFLADDCGNPVPKIGEVYLCYDDYFGNIRESSFVRAVRKIIHLNKDKKMAVIKVMKWLLNDPSQVWSFLSNFNELTYKLAGEGVYDMETAELNSLADGDLEWAIATAEGSVVRDDWSSEIRMEEFKTLRAGNLEGIAEFWRMGGCVRRQIGIELRKNYKLALFGIESPGGFQTWNAAEGDAMRHHWLPRGTSAQIDTYGIYSPEPAASRLFVPNERGDKVREAVIWTFLRHAKRLVLANPGADEWDLWLSIFLGGGLNYSRLSQSQLRQFLAEWRSEVGFHKAPIGLVAAAHSEFGRIVITRDLDGRDPYLNLNQPVSRRHIELAAAKVALPAKEIVATVSSLSEFLGWDITKGRGGKD